MMALSCKNEKHTEYLLEIDWQQIFCSNQIAGPDYTGSKFKFCPYCGKALLLKVSLPDLPVIDLDSTASKNMYWFKPSTTVKR